MAKKSSTKNKSALIGTNSADVLTVKHTQVTVNAGKGNDKINVNSGSSHKIYGEAGNDTIIVAAKAGSGSKIYGDDAKGKLTGKDTFTINGGKKNYFYGGKGVDTFKINGGNTNYFYGEAGNDVITVGTKAGSGSKIYGDDAKGKLTGNDKFTISGGKKNYFYGGKGADTFNVNGGTTNYIYGGAGRDTFVFGKKKANAIIKDYAVGQDTLKINSGNIVSATLKGKDVIIKAGNASVTLTGSATKTINLKDSRGSYTSSKTTIKLGKDFKGAMDANKFLSTVKTIDGRAAKNAINIIGNAQENIIFAGINGGTYKGGAGNDTFVSGPGDDIYIYENGNDTIYNFKILGTDTIQLANTTVNDILRNGETLLIYLSNNSILTVKDFADSKLIGKDVNSDKLTIQAGTNDKDFLTGGSDNDLIYCDAGNDSVLIVGGNNIVYGGAGDDNIIGGADDDLIYGDAGNDSLAGGTGNNIIFGGTGDDTFDGTGGNSNHFSGDDGNDTMYGGENNDVLHGGLGNDTLIGWGGDDLLFGGSGNDELSGGEGCDTFLFNNQSIGNSTINDYQVGYDIIEFDDKIGIISSSVKYGDVLLSLNNGGTINMKYSAGQKITFSDEYGKITTRTFS